MRYKNLGTDGAKVSNLQDSISMTAERFNMAFPNRSIDSIEYAEMCEAGWDLPRAKTDYQDYLKLLNPQGKAQDEKEITVSENI